jgi:hypothetical protein
MGDRGGGGGRECKEGEMMRCEKKTARFSSARGKRT